MGIVNRKKRIWKDIGLLYLFALMIFSPAIYYFVEYRKCKTRLENEASNVIVTGKGFGKIIYGRTGIGAKFEYNYKNKKYETGARGNFRNAPLEQILVFIEIDSLKPECYKVLFDSIFTNDTMQIEYFMEYNHRLLRINKQKE